MILSLTSLILVLLTLLTLAAWGLSLRHLRARGQGDAAGRVQQGLVVMVGAGAAALFIYHWLGPNGQWQPLAAHVDGLLLIAAILAGVVAFFQTRGRLLGLSAFALPLLGLILAWAICAATWTYHPFNLSSLHPLWTGMHLAGVYLGTLCAAVAAMAGGMYLYVQSRLKQKQNLGSFGHLASLEALETLIIRTATLGFALLTVGLVTGVIILSDDREALGEGWWYTPKFVLATLAWLAYALLMNVRYATSFRGTRAAWLAITGLVLLLATYGIVTALPNHTTARAATPRPLNVQRDAPDFPTFEIPHQEVR